MERDTEKECSSGLMGANMKDTDEATKQMGKEDSFIRTETIMKDISLMIKPMDKERT